MTGLKITLEKKKTRVIKGKEITRRAKATTIIPRQKTKNCISSRRQYAQAIKWLYPLKKGRT